MPDLGVCILLSLQIYQSSPQVVVIKNLLSANSNGYRHTTTK